MSTATLPRRKPALSLLRLLLDHLSIYLPVMLMGVLALGTYWLVRTTPVFAPAGPQQAPRHEPDYFMRDFAVKTFDPQGRLKSEVRGTEARHYPDTDTLEIDQVHLRSYSAEGQVTVASGRVAPRMEFRSEFLHAFTDTEKVRSHLPVVLIRGDDRFTGDAMDFDNLARTLELRGHVHGTLVPGVAVKPSR